MIAPPPTLPLRLVDSRWLTPSVRHFVFERSDGEALAFLPGQFVRVRVRDGEAPEFRSYSIANPNDAGRSDARRIELVVSLVEGGVGSAYMRALAHGDEIQATAPNGRFCLLPEDEAKRYVLLGTGTGVAPYRGMLPQLEALAARGVQTLLLLGNRTPAEQLYADEFRAAAARIPGFTLRFCHSRGLPEVPTEHDVHAYVQDALAAFALDPEGDIAYLCGNPNMVDAGFERLKAAGLHLRRIRREKYQTPRLPGAVTPTPQPGQ
ncbi:MAG: ferredoxin--NADP reductase [Xanthomonadales bacterium]|nr:ferredoxin--NADP reductase [Xanthomonadales bacterium]